MNPVPKPELTDDQDSSKEGQIREDLNESGVSTQSSAGNPPSDASPDAIDDRSTDPHVNVASLNEEP